MGLGGGPPALGGRLLNVVDRMKVQTKITLLLLAVVAVFIAGLGAFRVYDTNKFARIAAEREIERKQSFERFLEKDGEPLETLADYDAYWDPMVDAIARRDKAWFEKNINDESLTAYKADAAWVYAPDASTLVYSRDGSDVTPPKLPLPTEAFTKLFA